MRLTSPRRPGLTALGLQLAAAALGAASAAWALPLVSRPAHLVLGAFAGVLHLLGVPIVFLALLTTLLGVDSTGALWRLGRQVMAATLGTTFVAALLAWGLYAGLGSGGGPLWGELGGPGAVPAGPLPAGAAEGFTLGSLVGSWLPETVLSPFAEGNVVGAMLLAKGLGLSMVAEPRERRARVLGPTEVLLAAALRLIRLLLRGMPLFLWAAVVVRVEQRRHADGVRVLARFLGCVVAANLLQATLILPALLALHRLRPLAVLRGMAPALGVAFFSKSSVATVPHAMQYAESRLRLRPEVARFVFPVCTSININACAAFILTSILFVSQHSGRPITGWAGLGWTVVATFAALGNAGVPMGCFTLASAMLSAMHLDVTLMALVLPFYSLLDMLETAVNVWSDACVAAVVDAREARAALAVRG